jgi:hypothetical protein
MAIGLWFKHLKTRPIVRADAAFMLGYTMVASESYPLDPRYDATLRMCDDGQGPH